jgi:hypothetical protein
MKAIWETTKAFKRRGRQSESSTSAAAAEEPKVLSDSRVPSADVEDNPAEMAGLTQAALLQEDTSHKSDDLTLSQYDASIILQKYYRRFSALKGEELREVFNGRLNDFIQGLTSNLNNGDHKEVIATIQNKILAQLGPLAHAVSEKKLKTFQQWCDGLIAEHKDDFPEGLWLDTIKPALMAFFGVIVTLVTAMFRFIPGVSDCANSFFAKPDTSGITNLKEGLKQVKENVDCDARASFDKSPSF